MLKSHKLARSAVFWVAPTIQSIYMKLQLACAWSKHEKSYEVLKRPPWMIRLDRSQ